MKIKSLLFFSFLCWFGFSQQDVASIEIIDFNSTATYGPGSSVSVHFNPKGIFKFDDVSVTDDNQFFLELSTSGVDDWETISTLNGFFTTTMNGVIPDGASGFYQLRVRASKGLLSDTTTFGEVSSTPTSDFFIDGNNPSDTVIPYSGVSPNNNRFDCTAEGNYSNDAMFGSLTMSEGETSGDVISSSIQRRILITNLDVNSTYNIRRIDVIANTIESVASFASPTTFYTLPENIVIGTYNYEVEEINQSGISSIYTIILVLHRSSTTLGNNSAENVCTETDVIFNIDITSSGIGQNYRGSYYEFDFGDGSPTEIYTHAEILNNQELIHTYQEISCSSGQQFFDLRKDMYNKYNTDPDDECSYQKLGNGVIKQVNTSKGPEALFQSNDICENQSLSVINQSILGQYSISNADGCDDDANYYWDIVSPTGIIYEAFVEDGLPYGQIDWISGDNLLIPSTDLEPGCWSFRLTAVNENYCETESTYPPLNEGPYVVNVQAESDADFQFLNDNGEVIEEICFGQPVTFDNLSTVLDFDCQNVDYLWSISPESTPPSFVYVDPYDNSSESPVVIFNDPGTYDVTLQLSSICGQNSITKTITILGDPTINFDPDELTVCETETERAANGYTLDFSDSSISPIYSEAPFAPSSYTWTIVGDGNFNIDNSNAEYPVINFLDFGTYEISVQVNGSCTGSNNDTFTFNYQRTPVITNTDLNQEICTGFSTTPIVYQSDMTPLNVIYSIQLNGPDISGFNTDPTSYQTGIPAMNLVNDSDSPKTLIITVTPEIDGCIGADVDFTFTVNPEPDISSVILDNICSGGGFSFQPSDPSFENTVPVNTTYTWTVSSNIDPSTATGFTEPSFENAQPGPITQSNLQVSQVETLTYIVTPYFVSDSDSSIVCTGDDFTIQVTVVPDPEVSIITPLDYTICVGGVIPPIETSVTGGTGTPTYTWFKDGAPVDPPVNLPTYDAGIFNIAGVYEFNVTVSFDGSGCDPATSETVTVTVIDDPILTDPSPATQEICLGSPATPLVGSASGGDVGDYIFTWYNGDIVVGDGPTYTPPSDVVGTFYYYYVVTTDAQGADCETTSATAEVIVQLGPSIDTQPIATQTVCLDGATQELTAPYSNGVGVPTYQWYRNSTCDTSNTDDLVGTESTYTPPSDVVGTFYYYVVLTFAEGGCGAITSECAEVTVVPDPEVSIITPLDYTICVGGVIPPIETSVTGGTGTPTYTWFKDGAPVDPPVNLPTYDAGIFNIAGVYEFNVTVSFDGSGCDPATSETVTVTVLESPVAEIEPNEPQSICVNGNFDPLVASFDYAGISDSVNITWYYNTSNTTEIDSQTTIVDSGPFADNNTITPDSSTPSVRYYFFVLEFDPSVCEDPVSPTVQITVANPPSIASNPDANQTICVGGTIEENSLCVTINGGVEPIEYSWFAGFTYLVPNSEWGIFPPVVSSDSSNCLALPADFFDNPSFEGQDVKFWVVISFPGSNGCGGIFSDPATVSVLSDPILTDPSPATQEICLGSPATPLVGSATGGDVGDYIFTWYNGDIVVGDGPTYTPPSDVVGTFYYYYVVTTDAQGADCETTSATAEVIVQLGPSIDTQPIATQTVCLDGATQELTAPYSNGVGVPTYQWYRNSTCDTSNTDDLVGTESTYTPPSDVVGTFYYYVVLTFAEGGCGAITSECAEVTVVPDPEVSIITPLDYTICVGGVIPPIETSVTGGTGTPTYTWFKDGAPVDPPVNLPTYDAGIFNIAGVYEFNVTVSFDGSGCDPATSETVTVTVIDDPILTDPSPATQEICLGSPATPLVGSASGGDVGDYIFTWYNGDIVVGDGPTYTPPSDVVGTFYYYYVVTTDAQGADCETTSATAEVIVQLGPSIDTQPIATQTVCLDGATQELTAPYSNGVGVPTYQWYRNSTCDTSNTDDLVGTESTYTPPSDVVGTFYYYVVLTFAEGGCGAITSECAEVTVVPDPEVSIITPLDYTICVGGVIPPIETSVTGGTGTPTYTWFKDGAPVDPPVNLPTYDAGIFNIAGVYEFNVTVSFDGSGCDPATSETVTVTVIDDPILTDPSPATQEICLGSPATPLVGSASGGDVGDYIFTWYNGDIVVGDGPTYTPPSDVVGTFYYYYVVTTDAQGADCETTSATAEVIVQLGPSIDTQPIATQTVCLDGATQELTAPYSNGVGVPTYQWYRNSTCDTSNTDDLVGTESTYTPPSDVVGTFYYYVVLTFAEGGCGAITSECAEVTVVPDPEVSIITPLDYTICVGGVIPPIETSVTGGTGTPTYTWFKDGAPVDPPVNLPTYDAGIFNIAGVYEFNVTVSFDGSGCDPATSETVTVTVIDDPILTDPSPATQEICLGSPATPLVGSASGGDVGDYIFTWYNGDIVVGDGPTYTPPSDVVGTFYYYYVVTTDAQGADCETTSATAEVIVQPAPVISLQPIAEQTICQFDNPVQLTIESEGGVSVPTYQWYRNSTCDTSNTDDLVGTESTYTPPSDVVGTFYYYVVLTFAEGGCGSIVSECALVEITPVPIIPDVNVDICDLTSYTLSPEDGVLPTPDAIVPDETTYTWSIIDSGNIIFDPEDVATEIDFPSGIGAPSAFSSGILDNVDPNFILSTIVFEVTPWTGGCDGTSFFVSITVSPEPQINEVITNIACFDSEPLCAGSIEINPVGIAPFSYVWSSPSAGTVIPNPSDKDQFNLCPGLYDLTITDDSGCSYDYQYEIAPPEPITFDLESLTDVSCNNIDQEPCDGTIQVVATGGTRDYIYAIWYTDIDGDGDFDDIFDEEDDPNADFYDQNNLCADDYVLKIMDANGCVFVSPVYTIEEGAAQISVVETLSNYNGFNIDCYGANTGSISLEISGGSGIFDYTFTSDNPDFEDITANVNFQSSTQNSVTLDFEFLFFSNYTFSLIDSNCPFSIVRNYNLTQPDELVVSAQLVSPPLCFGDVATYEVTATGGIPPYVGTGLQAVLAGPVIFQVSDANGCEDDFSTVVLQPEELSVSVDIQDPFCFGDLGSITVNPSGGTGVLTVTLYSDIPPGGDPNDFIIDSDTTSAGNPVTFSQPDGEYFYSVTDLNGCEYGPEPFELIEPDPINIVDIEVVQPDCNTEPTWEFNNGSICITITGGTNAFPVGPGWVDNGGGVWCLNDLTAGTYSIDATDENNCPIQNPVQDIVLVRPPEITVSFTETISIDCDTNTATQTNFIFIDGGVPPYVITWSGGTAIPPNIMETSEPGNYSAFVNDQYGIANGCPPKEFPLDPITFFEFGIADFSISSSNSDFCGVFAVSDPVTFFNISTGDIVNYTWNFGDGSPDISNIVDPTHVYDVSGSYTISLTTEDIYGCFDTYEQTIDVTKGYEIILPNAFTPNGDGINETIRPVFNCMTEVQMSIYDTWGSLIYSESGEDIYGWDGTIDGNAAENGNYIMVVRAVSLNGNIIDLNGPVTLIK